MPNIFEHIRAWVSSTNVKDSARWVKYKINRIFFIRTFSQEYHIRGRSAQNRRKIFFKIWKNPNRISQGYNLERFSQRFFKILSVATKSSVYSAHSVVLFIIHSWLFMSIIINQKPLTLVKKAHEPLSLRKKAARA